MPQVRPVRVVVGLPQRAVDVHDEVLGLGEHEPHLDAVAVALAREHVHRHVVAHGVRQVRLDLLERAVPHQRIRRLPRHPRGRPRDAARARRRWASRRAVSRVTPVGGGGRWGRASRREGRGRADGHRLPRLSLWLAARSRDSARPIGSCRRSSGAVGSFSARQQKKNEAEEITRAFRVHRAKRPCRQRWAVGP